MILFVLGAALAYTIEAGMVLVLDPAVRRDNPWLVTFTLTVCVIPTVCVWASAEVCRAVRRSRLLTHGASRPITRLGAGVLAGLLGCAGAIIAVAWFNNPYQPRSDLWFTGPAAAAGALAVLIPWPRVRRGCCVRCRYDLSSLTPASKGLCPECGADLFTP